MAIRSAARTVEAKRKASREKARAYRARMREKGLRPVQFWLPNVNSPEFIAEAYRQSLAVSRSPSAADDQAFIDALTDWGED